MFASLAISAFAVQGNALVYALLAGAIAPLFLIRIIRPEFAWAVFVVMINLALAALALRFSGIAGSTIQLCAYYASGVALLWSLCAWAAGRSRVSAEASEYSLNRHCLLAVSRVAATTAALAAAALERGIVNSLAGDASVADLNRLFFDGNLGIEAGERTPTKAEAASFIATALGSEVGKALLERRNLAAGVSGDVTEVALEQGHHGNVYVLTIGGIKLQMDEHGRVANGPTDLLQWEGRSVRRSFIRGSGDHAQWMYLEAEPRRAAPADAAPAATGTVTSELVAAAVEEPAADRSVFYWLVAVAVILGAVLFIQRRRSD